MQNNICTYHSVSVGVMYHPTFTQYDSSFTLRMFDGLHNSLEWDIATLHRAVHITQNTEQSLP